MLLSRDVLTKEETLMKNWWDKNKRIIIVFGVIFIMLALLLLPAFARVGYEKALERRKIFWKGKYRYFYEYSKRNSSKY